MTIDIVADALATADAEAQAQFINNFSRHLKLVCKGREDTQLSYIADELDENGRWLMKSLHEFSELSLETRAKTEQAISDLWKTKHELEVEIAALTLQKSQQEPLCQ